MRAVSAVGVCAGPLEQVERRWYDVQRWPEWVDGLERIDAVDGQWPHEGATVRWTSGPAGRGEVCETVESYQPGAGQCVRVQDPAIEGRQTVRFVSVRDGVEVALRLEYRLRRHPLLMWLVDALFVARAMRASLESTLQRFSSGLAKES